MALLQAAEERPSGAQIAGRAWRSVFEAARQMPVLVISALVVLTVLAIGLAALRFAVNTGGGAVMQARLAGAAFGLGLLQSGLNVCATSLIAAPVAVAMHRFILLGEVSGGAVSLRSRRTLTFFLWVAGLQLVIAAVNHIANWLVISNNFPFQSLARFGLITLAVEAPLVLAVWIFLIYLALLFPALAIDEPVAGARARISASIGRMRGHFWQFVGAIVLTCAPVTVIGTLATFALLQRMMVTGLLGRPRHSIGLDQLQDGWLYTSMFLGALESILTIALAASVASWLYASIAKASQT